ncbi:MAG TPA: hypothetical protein G4O03_01155 [Dehalococcoidia bacterium]|nr:hypothetical protein [Dehalococcoidia bacterium]
MTAKSALPIIAALTVCIIPLLGTSPALAQDERLVNGTFDANLVGWQTWPPGQTSLVWEGGAARLTIHPPAAVGWVYQDVAIQGGGDYAFSGSVRKNDGDVAAVCLRIRWYDEAGNLIVEVSSPSITEDSDQYRLLSTGVHTAPKRAVKARAMGVATASGQGSVWFDNLSLVGPAPQPLLSPSPAPGSTANPSPTSQDASPPATPDPGAAPSPPLPATGQAPWAGWAVPYLIVLSVLCLALGLWVRRQHQPPDCPGSVLRL